MGSATKPRQGNRLRGFLFPYILILNEREKQCRRGSGSKVRLYGRLRPLDREGELSRKFVVERRRMVKMQRQLPKLEAAEGELGHSIHAFVMADFMNVS